VIDDPAEIAVHILQCRYVYLEEWKHPNLQAPYWRVYWNADPGWRAVLGERAEELGPRRLLVIPPETPFAAQSVAPSHHLYVHFSAGEPYDRPQPALIAVRVSPWLRDLIDRICTADPASPHAAAVQGLLVHTLCAYALCAVSPAHLTARRPSPRIAEAIAYFLRDCCNTGMPNGVLARHVGMNTNAFIRLFKSDTGRTPHAWLTGARIDRACVLLHHSFQSIDRIASELGFCDRYHFSRVFRKLRGMGPAEFRRRGRLAEGERYRQTNANRPGVARVRK
jgi:AraC-like DNA-binding protein